MVVVIGPRVVVVIVNMSESAIGFVIWVTLVGEGMATTLTINLLAPLTLDPETRNVILEFKVKNK